MRSRPKLDLRLRPGKVSPGQTVEVIATFDSRSRTPIDKVEFRLNGPLLVPAGQVYFAHQPTIRLAARHTPREFTTGRHEVRARFAIPPNAPPSFRSRGFAIEYVLSVHVDIPWWPDVDKRYVVPVVLPPSAPRSASPGVFCTDSRGPRERVLYAEASLDDVVVEPGGVVTGAVSFNNTAFRRMRGVEVAFVSKITAIASGTTWETHRYAAPVCSGTPPESEAVPFRVRVPSDVTPEFATPWARVAWHLEVAIDTGWSREVLLAIPIRVVPATAGGASALVVGSSAPSVGRERRMRLWSTVAQQLSLQYDAAAETLRLSHGTSTATITLEQGGSGLQLCASLAWPSLGIDIDVGPAQWTDRFATEEINVGDAAFDEQFRVRGRVAEQILAVLSTDVRRALLGSLDARVHDEGARFSIADAGLDPERLASFARHTARLLEAFEKAFANVPPPVRLASHRDAWVRFAERLAGRLEIGRMWIHGGSFGMEQVEVGTNWMRDGEFDSTLLRVRFEEPITSSFDPDEPGDAPEATKTLAREIRASARDATFGPDAITVELGALFTDPIHLEPHLERMSRLARALTGRLDLGPYR